MKHTEDVVGNMRFVENLFFKSFVDLSFTNALLVWIPIQDVISANVNF